MNNKLVKFSDIWKKRQDFTFLLGVLAIYIFIVIPFLSEGTAGKIFFVIFYIIFLSSGINFIASKRRLGILLFFIIIPVLLLVSEILYKLKWEGLGVDVFLIIYCGWLGTVILIRTFSKGHLTINRVQGAIIVYLLIGLAFGLLYHGIYLLNEPNAFRGLVTFHRSEFIYFSMTSLTTLGFGDIVPVNVFARVCSNMEALNGQLYPAILIARLVSMEFNSTG